MTVKHVENVIPQACQWRRHNLPVALVTLVGIDGSSPRPLGSQMAVNANGESVGLISGGCLEAAVAEEARRALAQGCNRLLRYGKGSPFFDIRLPCGSGIDVLIDVCLADELLFAVERGQAERKPQLLCLDLARRAELYRAPNSGPGPGVMLEICDDSVAVTSERNGDSLVRAYPPQKRLLLMGAGSVHEQLLALAPTLGFETVVAGPDTTPGDRSIQLLRPEDFSAEAWCDPWTAAALLFHDHDWEGPLLASLLRSPCYYIGALGSRRSHEQRCRWLQAQGFSAKETERIKGPIGLNIGAQTPPEIAISVLAELIERGAGL